MQKPAVKRKAPSSNTRASRGECEGSSSCACSDIPVCVRVAWMFAFIHAFLRPFSKSTLSLSPCLYFTPSGVVRGFSCHVSRTCEQMVVRRSEGSVIKGSECDPVLSEGFATAPNSKHRVEFSYYCRHERSAYK